MSSQYGEHRFTSRWDLLASLGHPCKFQWVLHPGSITAWHSSSGRQPDFAALNRGCHLYSARRPSRWALAHMSSCFATHALAVGPWSCSFYWCSIVCGWELQISTTWCASMVQAELSPSYKLYSFKHLTQNRMLRSLWQLPFMASMINFIIFPVYVILLCSVEYSESSLQNCFLIVNRCLLVSWIRCCIGEPA